MGRWRKLFGSPSPELELTPELERRIRSTFEEAAADEENFPSAIDPRIYHVRLIAEHLGALAGQRVLDLGSGKGRFARVLFDEQPKARFVALDVSVSMLRRASPDTPPCAATMNALPFPDESFDGAYAVESLEHAVDVSRAVAELCRVVRPGGRIAVIDKNAEQWGRLETAEWERWFTRKEMERLLGRWCGRVESRFVSYWDDVEPDGLFIAWLAWK